MPKGKTKKGRKPVYDVEKLAFTTGGKGRKPAFIPMSSNISRAIKANAKGSNNPLKQAGVDLLATAAYSAGVKIGETTVELLKDSLMNDGRKVPSTESHSKSGFKQSNVMTGSRYKTKFESGKPSTSAVNRVANQNGSRKFTYYDTMTEFTTPDDRRNLSGVTGFNQKGIFAYSDLSFWSFKDLFTFMPFDTYKRPTVKSQRSYLMTKYFGVETKIMNQNKYSNFKVKVHWLRQMITPLKPTDMMAKCFTDTLVDNTSTVTDTIPYNLQLSVKAAGQYITYCAIDPVDGSMSKAPSFRENFDVVKTMTKVLKPGDIWELDYRHHTGSGLVLEDMFDKWNTKSSNEGFNEEAAAFYYPIFEVVGPQVEAFESTDALAQDSYVGTAPCAIHFEFRKFAEIAQASYAASSLVDTTLSQGGFRSERWAIRSFTAPGPLFDTGTVTRRFNLPISSILKADETTAAGKYIIPVTTDYTTARGGRPNLS